MPSSEIHPLDEEALRKVVREEVRAAMAVPTEGRVMRVSEAAEFLGCSEWSIRQGIRQYEVTDGVDGLCPLRIGTSLRVTEKDLIAWAKRQAISSA